MSAWEATSVPVPAIFYTHCCESLLKSTNQVGRFYHMTFQNGGTNAENDLVVVWE